MVGPNFARQASIFSGSFGLFGSLRVGGRFHWAKRCEGSHLGAAIDSGATMLFAVPTQYHRLAHEAEVKPALATQLASLRRGPSFALAYSMSLLTLVFWRTTQATEV